MFRGEDIEREVLTAERATSPGKDCCQREEARAEEKKSYFIRGKGYRGAEEATEIVREISQEPAAYTNKTINGSDETNDLIRRYKFILKDRLMFQMIFFNLFL
jgi:hypothetical protein